MLETLSHDRFAACLKQSFRVDAEGSPIDLELIAVDLLGDPGGSGARQPFSLLFRGPREPVLLQRIRRLENATLGTLEIFLVPVGPDEHGLRYEAVFN